MSPLLELNGLTVELPTSSGWVRPVNDVSLRIGAGECLGLVGESGSGKTMLPLVHKRPARRGSGSCRPALSSRPIPSAADTDSLPADSVIFSSHRFRITGQRRCPKICGGGVANVNDPCNSPRGATGARPDQSIWKAHRCIFLAQSDV